MRCARCNDARLFVTTRIHCVAMLSARPQARCLTYRRALAQPATTHSVARRATPIHYRSSSMLRAKDGESGAPSQPATAQSNSAPSVEDTEPEVTFLETSGSNVELAVSILLGFTLIYAPLTIISLGKRAWFKTKFTNKRVIVDNSSPLFKSTIHVEYSKIKEVRAAPTAFGLWGNMVIFLKDGSRLELTGLERFQEIQSYIEKRVLELEQKRRSQKVESLKA